MINPEQSFIGMHTTIRNQYRTAVDKAHRLNLKSIQQQKDTDIGLSFLARAQEYIYDIEDIMDASPAESLQLSQELLTSFTDTEDDLNIALQQLTKRLVTLSDQPFASLRYDLRHSQTILILRRLVHQLFSRRAIINDFIALRTINGPSSDQKLPQALEQLRSTVTMLRAEFGAIEKVFANDCIAPWTTVQDEDCKMYDRDISFWLQVQGLTRYNELLADLPWNQLKSLTLTQLNARGVGSNAASRLRTLGLMQSIGWCTKAGIHNKAFKRRYIVLLESCELLYFKAKDSINPQGSIILSKISSISSNPNYQIDLTSSARVYQLRFENKEQMQLWIKLLTVCIR